VDDKQEELMVSAENKMFVVVVYEVE